MRTPSNGLPLARLHRAEIERVEAARLRAWGDDAAAAAAPLPQLSERCIDAVRDLLNRRPMGCLKKTHADWDDLESHFLWFVGIAAFGCYGEEPDVTPSFDIRPCRTLGDDVVSEIAGLYELFGTREENAVFDMFVRLRHTSKEKIALKFHDAHDMETDALSDIETMINWMIFETFVSIHDAEAYDLLPVLELINLRPTVLVRPHRALLDEERSTPPGP